MRALHSHSPFRVRRPFAAVAVLACIALTVPATALGAAKGLETEISWDVSSGVQSQDAAALKDLGAGWTRITVSWHDAEPAKGSLDSSYMRMLDNAVSLARANGAQVLLDPYGSPSWASGTSNRDAPPQNPADYASFVTRLAQRYTGRVAAYEIWNEENIGRFWNGSPDPGAYARLLQAAYPAVKAGDGNALVLFGGMSTNDWPYLESVYAAAPDIGRSFDVMATHPYDPPNSPDYVYYDGGRISRYAFAGYRSVHDVMHEHGDDKPIWFTEFGWSTTSQPNMGVTAQQQADYTKLAYACIQQDPYVQVAILYELRNNWWAGDADDWEDQLGLVTTNWTHKPAYDAFKSIDPSQGGCTYHDGSGPIAPPASQQPSGSSASTQGAKGGSTSSTAPVKHRVVVHVRRARGAKAARAGGRHKLSVYGKVSGARDGRVVLRFERKDRHGRWRRYLTTRLPVGGNGRFSRSLGTRLLGRWRVRAIYVSADHPASRFAYFRT